MTERDLRIDVLNRGRITAIATEPEGDSAGWTFVYAPGAGSSVHDPFGKYACRTLAKYGFTCVRFQFPYQEAERHRPDPPQVLEATWRAVVELVRLRPGRIAVTGRSMGGRIGSMVVADGLAADAVALFAYPLHPPGQPEKRRIEHLSALTVPTLFCSGTRDAFGTPEELREAAALVPRSTVHVLEHANHAFEVPKASGRTRQEVWAEATGVARDWLLHIPLDM